MSSPSTTDARFSAFRQLYGECVARIVQWSEGEILSREYLHLHEADIGIGARGYRLGDYVLSFLRSLGDLVYAFQRIVFCYSYENTEPGYPACVPSQCRRERFFWYEITVAEGRAVERGDITFPNGGVDSQWITPAPLSTLRDALAGCQWVQPYMLREDGAGLDAHFELQSASSECLQTLEAWHRRTGSYQFSIYGFQLKDGRHLTEPEALLVNLAFLVHVWTWNHDLRTAHLLRGVVMGKLPVTRELWNKFYTSMQSMLDTLRDLHLTKDDYSDLVVPMSSDAVKALFESPHDLSTWTPESFPAFVGHVHRLSGARVAADFLAHCGWPVAEVKVEATPSWLTHARATWLAVRYLTRCALDGGQDYRKVSFDQVVLATLFGVHQGGAPEIPVRVVRTIELHATEETAVPRAEEALRLVSSATGQNWPQRKWVSRLDHAGDQVQRVSVEWDTKCDDDGAAALPLFLRSGMMAMQVGFPSLQVFPLPASDTQGETILAGHLLFAVSRLARALARQRVYSDQGFAVLSTIIAEADTVVAENGRRTHRARLRFQLDKLLPDSASAAAEFGELRGPLTRLAELWGARSPIRVKAVTSDNWGLFVVTPKVTSEIVLTFEEGTS